MSFNLDQQITLSPHAALKTRADEEILVLPERAIRLRGSSGEILRLCKERRSARDVIAEMQLRYPNTPQIGAEVGRFLSEMLETGGLITEPPGVAKGRG